MIIKHLDSKQYVQMLWDFGYKSFDDLDDAQKATLTGVMLEEEGKWYQPEFLSEEAEDIIPCVIKMLQSHNDAELNAVYRTMVQKQIELSAIKHFKKRIEKMFETHKEFMDENQTKNTE